MPMSGHNGRTEICRSAALIPPSTLDGLGWRASSLTDVPGERNVYGPLDAAERQHDGGVIMREGRGL